MANWGQLIGGGLGAAAGGLIAGPAGVGIGAGLGSQLGGQFGSNPNGTRNKYQPNQANFMLPGYQDQYNQYGNLANQYGNTGLLGGVYRGNQSQFAGDQRQLANMLMAQAQGNGPGQELARRNAQMMADRGASQQVAMAQASRPGQGALATRRAANTTGQLQSQAGAQAVTGGLQAQLGAASQLGGVLQGARAGDLAYNQYLTGRDQGMNQNRIGAFNATSSAQLDALRQRLMAAQMQQQGGQAYENALRGNSQFNANQTTNFDRLLGGIGAFGDAYMQYNAGKKI